MLVPGLTDDEDGLRQLASFISGLNAVERVEVLPYHTFGAKKWELLGVPYPLEGVRPPNPEEIAKAERILGISSE